MVLLIAADVILVINAHTLSIKITWLNIFLDSCGNKVVRLKLLSFHVSINYGSMQY
jgi:hypothetical protein